MTKQIYEATFIRRDERIKTRAIVNINFQGSPLEVTFPYEILEKAGLNPGDNFKYPVRGGYETDPSQICKVENKTWTNEEKEDILKFIQKSAKIQNN